MNAPKAVFVIGPESSGTRLMTRLLIRAGCVGDDTHFQPFDTHGLPAASEGRDVVWRRSLPHGGQWPDLVGMIQDARELGYDVRVVFMQRDDNVLILSQVAATHARTAEEAETHIMRAYSDYHDRLNDWRVLHYNVSYELLTADGWAVMLDLLEWLALSTVFGVTLYDGNRKHLKREEA